MDAFYFVENTLKFVRERTQTVGKQMTEGSVPDFNSYLKLRAQYEAWVGVESQLISLLKQYGIDDE